jgi:hypothetical protein
MPKLIKSSLINFSCSQTSPRMARSAMKNIGEIKEGIIKQTKEGDALGE